MTALVIEEKLTDGSKVYKVEVNSLGFETLCFDAIDKEKAEHFVKAIKADILEAYAE